MADNKLCYRALFLKVLLTATTCKADSTVEPHLNGWGIIIRKSQSQTKFEYFWKGLIHNLELRDQLMIADWG